jgi:Flp pilus assembly protein TadB
MAKNKKKVMKKIMKKIIKRPVKASGEKLEYDSLVMAPDIKNNKTDTANNTVSPSDNNLLLAEDNAVPEDTSSQQNTNKKNDNGHVVKNTKPATVASAQSSPHSVSLHTIIGDTQFHKFESDEALKKLFSKEKEKSKKYTVRQRFFLRNVLKQAGYEGVDEQKFKDTVLYANALIIILLSIIVLFYGSFNYVLFKAFLFLLVLWVLLLPLLLFITWSGIYLYLDYMRYRRRMALEDVWPEYLQLVVANINAGMLIDVALWSAVKPRYRVLAKEIEEIAKQTVTGVDISIALKDFSDKYDSPMLTRTINLLIEGMGSGGKIATLLNKIALDIQDTAIMKKEMSASVTTYAIFISFATIAAAPFLFGLSTQLLMVMQKIIGSVAQTSSASSMMTFGTDTIKVNDFRIFAYLMLSITSFMSACIIGTIRKGSIKAGLKFIPIFIIVTIIIYAVASTLLSQLMSSFI